MKPCQRDLKRRRFRQLPLEEPVSRPGARHYVVAIEGSSWRPVLGPYASHTISLMHVARGERLVLERYAHDIRVAFAHFGTCSHPRRMPTVFGR